MNSDEAISARDYDRRRSRVFRYGLAIVATLAATSLRYSLQPHILTHSPFLSYVLAVVITARLGGTAAGLFATALSGFAGTYFFVEPVFDLWIYDTANRVQVALFTLIGVVVSSAGASRRRVSCGNRVNDWNSL
jgi:K+-sensing histidine kinase KdpD